MTTFRQIYYSFPFRLLGLHFRNHLILILLWAVLAAFSTGLVGRFFGMHYLLLTPEYQGRVDFWSFFLTGAAFGICSMIWHLTTYLLSAARFAFLATLDAPFTKFCLNNSLVPLAFLAIYLSCSVWFQWHDELTSTAEVVSNIAGFLFGATAFVSLLAVYFYFTNKDMAALLRVGKFSPKPGGRLLVAGQRLPTLWEIKTGATRWRVDTYLNERLHARLVRSVAHYNPALLEQVFRQNHANAVVVQLLMLGILVAQGAFMDSAWVRVPTAATLFVLASMGMALFGAITFWFRQWSLLVFLALAFVINLLSGWGIANYRNRAYGLDYQREKRVEYNYAALEKIASRTNTRRDEAATLRILENWKSKNQAAGPKPKMVFLCVSGGGMRAALWTMQTLQKADFATSGKLLRQSALITGASGGMLGAAYVREAMLRQSEGERQSPQDPALLDNMGKDLLNPVSFAVVANDLFFPLSTFRSGNFTYRKDRGYMFENQLNENCDGYFSKRLADYRQPEAEARIPMMVVSPFVLNDARRMLISPQGVSYLMRPHNEGRLAAQVEIDGVDFGKIFAAQQADSLAFSSALRMNCTYPLILPNVWLPTKPSVEAVDAGFRDNYGLGLAVRFVHTFRHWIEENTSGVVFVQIRCWEKIHPVRPSDDKGILENMLTPASAAANLTKIADFEQDNALALLNDAMGKSKIEVVRFFYRPVRKQREASLSFHLSKREKLDLLESFYSPENKAALKALKQILGN
jgi:hypothetical protein